MPQGPFNLGRVISLHAQFRRAHRELEQKEARRAGEFALQHVQQNATFKRRTGKLQDGTTYRVVRLANGVVLKLANKVPYANAIEFGARPHRIEARPGHVLAFRGHGGAMVFRRSVMHPGNRPYKFLYRATSAAGRVFESAMQSGMEKLAKFFESAE